MQPARKLLDPYLQGELDKLCGIYSIINAIQQVMGFMPERKAIKLFNLMVRQLDKQERLAQVLTNGMSIGTLIGLLRLASKDEALRFHRPFIRRKNVARNDLFKATENGCAIIRIVGEGRNHWTVMSPSKTKKVALCDSDECGDFSKSSFVGYGTNAPKKGFKVVRQEVIVLRRS